MLRDSEAAAAYEVPAVIVAVQRGDAHAVAVAAGGRGVDELVIAHIDAHMGGGIAAVGEEHQVAGLQLAAADVGAVVQLRRGAVGVLRHGKPRAVRRGHRERRAAVHGQRSRLGDGLSAQEGTASVGCSDSSCCRAKREMLDVYSTTCPSINWTRAGRAVYLGAAMRKSIKLMIAIIAAFGKKHPRRESNEESPGSQ